jgi:transposase
MTAYRFYVGIDWATEVHRVVVLDADRRRLHDRTVRHDGVALETFAGWLADDVAAGVASDVAVALEMPRGAVVDTLLARGFHVFALNPKQLDRFRDRYTVAGAKDDRRDAQVLASALASDPPAFRRLEPEHPLLLELRELSRLEDDLRHEFGRLTNRLREQLHRYFPQLLHLVPAADEPWLWALLERAPTPSAAQHLPRATLRTLLARHRIRRVDPDTLRALLRTPALAVAPGTVQAAQRHLAVLLPRLRLIHQQQAECATLIEGLLQRLGESQEHRDVPILRSVVGVGRVVAATMLAEASRLLAARDYHGLRAQSGVAPVTRQSGRRSLVIMRYACNPRLRYAAYHWGQSAARHDPVSRAHYARLRARGHSHARAVRGIVDRLLRVLVAMLTAGTLYDPSRRRTLPAAA